MKILESLYEIYYTVGTGLMLYLTTGSSSFVQNEFAVAYIFLVFLFSALFAIGLSKILKKLKNTWTPKSHAH